MHFLKRFCSIFVRSPDPELPQDLETILAMEEFKDQQKAIQVAVKAEFILA